MATLNLILDKRYQSADETYPLIIRVRHKGKVKDVSLKIKLKDSQFENGKIVNHPNARIKNNQVATKINQIEKYIADCELHGRPLRLGLIGSEQTSYSFTEYLQHRAKQYRAKNQFVMERKINRFVVEIKNCFGGQWYFDQVNPDTLRDLEAYLVNQGNGNNTRGKKFKFLGQYYGNAISEGKASAPNHFKEYKIPRDPVKKQKLTVKQIQAIEELPLAKGPVNDARNLFLFSYYTKGSRFTSCLMLTRKQISGGRVNITMGKGKKHVSVQIHSRLKKILGQYKGDPVFPFVEEVPAEGSLEYLKVADSWNTVVNRNLKVVGSLCGIRHITFHMARHSFAQHLKENTGSIHVIKEALGHSDTRTTEIYLQSLGDERLDKEMKKVYGK